MNMIEIAVLLETEIESRIHLKHEYKRERESRTKIDIVNKEIKALYLAMYKVMDASGGVQ